jgi:hypothetical protein
MPPERRTWGTYAASGSSAQQTGSTARSPRESALATLGGGGTSANRTGAGSPNGNTAAEPPDVNV